MCFLNRVIVRRFCTAISRSTSTAVSNNKELELWDRILHPDSTFMRLFGTRDTIAAAAKSTFDFIRYRSTDEASMKYRKLCASKGAKAYADFLPLTQAESYSNLLFDPELPFMHQILRYSVDSLLALREDRNIYDDVYFPDMMDNGFEEEEDDPDWSPEEKLLLLCNNVLVDRFKDKEYHQAEKQFSNPSAWAKSLGFPDSLSYQIMIKGLCIQGLVDRALSLLDEMHRKDMHATRSIYYAIVAAFHTQGRSSEVGQVWKRMEEHDRGGFCQYDHLASQELREEAKRMHRHLLLCGCDPQEVDILMINTVNSGYETASLLQKKSYLFDKHSKMDEGAELANSGI